METWSAGWVVREGVISERGDDAVNVQFTAEARNLNVRQ